MKEYDMDVTACQIVRIKAESEEEAIEEAFYKTFNNNQDKFAWTKHEIVDVKEV